MYSAHLGDATAAILRQNAHHTSAEVGREGQTFFLTIKSGDDSVPGWKFSQVYTWEPFAKSLGFLMTTMQVRALV